MDLQKIKALIDLLAESPLASLEVIEGDERVKLVKSKRRGKRGGDARPAGDERTSPDAESASELASLQPSASSGNASENGNDASRTAHVTRAPMFGVVHLTPAPGEAPFVKPGDAVEVGQVLCTIEAMKMFNAIECEHGGTILDILVEPGGEVESGQPLFRIG